MDIPQSLLALDFRQGMSTEVSSTLANVTLDQLPLVLAYILSAYVNERFDFQMIEVSLQHLHDRYLEFKDSLFEALSTGEILFDNAKQQSNFYNFILEIMQMRLFTIEEWKLRLEPQTLKAVNLIGDPVVFNRKSVRHNTSLVYKQIKYNLLRESSMGYSFLLVDLSQAIKKQLSPLQLNEIFRNYIGSFNLDVMRVVDAFLALFELNVETHYEYFLTALSNCPWFEPNGHDMQEIGVQLYTSVLGFRFVNLPNTNTDKLYHVTALMIKHKLVNLETLYPQLAPSAQDWELLYQGHIKRLKGLRHAIAANSLEGAQRESSDNSRNQGLESEGSTPTAQNQKLGLLNALLSIGDLKSSEWILLRNTGFLGFDSTCSILLCRLINAMLSHQEDHHSKAFAPISLTGINASSASVLKIKRTYQVLSPLNLQPDQTFYYMDWAEAPKAEAPERVIFWLRLLGPNIRDCVLFAKLASMAKEPLKLPKDSPERTKWTNIIRTSLLPSILVCGGNEGNHNMLWDTLSVLPSSERFGFYGDWIYGSQDRSPETKALLFSSRIKVNQLTSRITSENSREFGRLFKTEILNSPGVVFSAVLKAIMRYDQNSQFVEVFRFLSKLAADVFHFVLLDLLSDPETRGVMQPSRLKDDCVNIESWLKHLAQFVCSLCRKYSFFSISVLLTYITNQLHNGNSFDLVFLSEFLIKLGGIEACDNSDDLYSLNGGKSLKSEAYPQNASNRATSSSAGRLADALVNSKLLPILVVLLARQQQSVIYNNKTGPKLTDDLILTSNLVPGLTPLFVKDNKQGLFLPKVMSSHIDSIQDVLLRLTELIANHVNPVVLEGLLPNLDQLCINFGLDPVLAFNFLRLSLSYHVSMELKNPKSEGQSVSASEVEQGELVEDSTQNNTATNPPETCEPTPTLSYQAFSLASLKNTIHLFQKIYPQKIFDTVRPEFFVTFWQLRLYDIFVPVERYQSYISKLKETLSADQRQSGHEGEEERARLKRRIDLLVHDKDEQADAYKKSMTRLTLEKASWFNEAADPAQVASLVFEECIMQRCVFSGQDALFCVKFLFILHELDIPTFSLSLVMDRLMLYFERMLFLFTSSEARHFGLFLGEILYKIHEWYSSKSLFDKEAIGNNSRVFVPEAARAQSTIKDHPFLLEQDVSEHHIFQFQLSEWHKSILTAVNHCLESGEYMQTHNAFLVLAQLERTFPTVSEHCAGILERIVTTLQNDTHKEFSSLALAYKAKLLKLQARCVPMSSFSKIQGLIQEANKPKPPSASKPVKAPQIIHPPTNSGRSHSRQDPVPRTQHSSERNSRLIDEGSRSHHQVSSTSINNKRSSRAPHPELTVENRPQRAPARDLQMERSASNGIPTSRFPPSSVPRDRSVRYDRGERRPPILPPSRNSRESPRNDNHHRHVDNSNTSNVNRTTPPPFKRRRNDQQRGNGDYEGPRGNTPPPPQAPLPPPEPTRSFRQRPDGSAEAFGMSSSLRRGGMNGGGGQSTRRMGNTNNIANAHLQDNSSRRHDSSSQSYSNRQGGYH